MANYPNYNLLGKRPADTYRNIVQYNITASNLVDSYGDDLPLLNITASRSITASFVASASFAGQSISASYAPSIPQVSASYALSASWSPFQESASYAMTASAATSITFVPDSASYAISASHANILDNVSFESGVNTIIGVGAGPTSGKFNTTIVGYNAGKKSSGSFSGADGATIIGAQAAENCITTFLATIIGQTAAQDCVQPTGATIIGNGAASSAGNVWGAVIIGGSAGQYADDAGFATMVGSVAGQNAKTASYATFIGRGADAATVTSDVEGSTAIGFNAKVSGPYMCVIGGTGSYAVNVGIGISSPQAALHISKSDAMIISGSITYPLDSLAANQDSYSIDFSKQYQTLTTTGSFMLSSSFNGTSVRNAAVYITSQSVSRSISFNPSWMILGTVPTSISADKTAILSLTSFGSNESLVVVAYGVQQ